MTIENCPPKTPCTGIKTLLPAVFLPAHRRAILTRGNHGPADTTFQVDNRWRQKIYAKTNFQQPRDRAHFLRLSPGELVHTVYKHLQ
jgi:hypothetical protein